MRASVALVVSVALTVPVVPAVAQYQTHAELQQDLRELAAAHRGRSELITIATSPGGRAVDALRVGPSDRPALLVVAGAHGPQLIGSSIAMAAARELLADAGATTPTVWFIPRLNPDAAEAMFAAVRTERTSNDATGYDDDHDQSVDEDGVDDLDGNGMITSMLVADPTGSLIADSVDPRLFRRAAADHGEVGRYRMLREGRDDDGDESWNEDGPGGIDVNRNFSFAYPHHGSEAGRDPFAAPEARGLAEFLMAHPEVAAVYVVGPQDNLMTPWENRPNQGVQRPDGSRAQEGTSQGGPLHSILRQDQATFADMSRRFQQITGLTSGSAGEANAGDVLSWAYYHFGRWAFGSRGWWVPKAEADSGARGSRGGGGSDANAAERNALRWFAAHDIDAFVPWHPVDAVTAGGEPVQVGGFKPGALLNPPAGVEFDSTVARHGRFIRELAGMLPQIGLRDVTVTQLGDGLYRISAEVINTGRLPSTTALAARLRNPRRIRVDLDLAGTTLVSGDAMQLVGPLAAAGGHGSELTWTVAGRPGTALTLTAGSPVTGTITQTVTLR